MSNSIQSDKEAIDLIRFYITEVLVLEKHGMGC